MKLEPNARIVAATTAGIARNMQIEPLTTWPGTGGGNLNGSQATPFFGQAGTAGVPPQVPRAQGPGPIAGGLITWQGPPQIASAPVVTGTGTVGQVLTTTPGVWNGFPITGYVYAWQRSGATIAGATAATYTLVAADSGNVITSSVIASNAYGASTPAPSITGIACA